MYLPRDQEQFYNFFNILVLFENQDTNYLLLLCWIASQLYHFLRKTMVQTMSNFANSYSLPSCNSPWANENPCLSTSSHWVCFIFNSETLTKHVASKKVPKQYFNPQPLLCCLTENR